MDNNSSDIEKAECDINMEEVDEVPEMENEKTCRITTKKYAAFTAMCVVVLTESLDATSIAVVLPVIAESLESSTTATFSLATSFLLAATLFQPVFASLSIIFDRKPVMLAALGLFFVGAIIGGSANKVFVLLGGRIVQGIGAAGTISLTVVTVTDIVSLRNRAPWIACLNAMWAIGSVSGPVIGGAFGAANWRSIFWINIPLVIASFTGVVVFLQLKPPGGPLRGKLADFDYVGVILFLMSATGILVPITLAGTIYPWASINILLPLILGAFGLVIFICYEKWLAGNPMVRLTIFRNRTTKIGHAGILVDGIILWMLLYYLPLYYEGVRGYSPLKTGIAVFPETFTVVPANIMAAVIISKTGRYRWSILSGRLLTALGMGLLCLLKKNTPIVAWVFINLVPGIGIGITMPGSSVAIQAATSSEDAAHAISMYYLLRAIGQTVGVVIGGAIFRDHLKSALAGGDATATVESLLRTLRALRDGGGEDQLLVEVVAKALQQVWAVGCGLAVIAGIGSIWMKEYSLDQKQESGVEGPESQTRTK